MLVRHPKVLTLQKVFLVLVYICFLVFVVHQSRLLTRQTTTPTRQVTIYAATAFFSKRIDESFLANCSEDVRKTCRISNNSSDVGNADAIVFHSSNFDENKSLTFEASVPRNPNVPYVMWFMESPPNAYLQAYRHFFNWTMSYTRESDVASPYGRIEKNEEKVKVDYDAIWREKDKTALWLVSTTSSNHRKLLVEAIVARGLPVDLLGRLYNKEPAECPRSKAFGECDRQLHTPYKFYMSLENNNCHAYVTEKFWKKAHRFHMVPIVMQRSIYREVGIPDSMYIAIDDFPTLADFVAHVNDVSANRTAYLEYHRWREDFRIVVHDEETLGFCELCRKVTEPEGEPRHKSYENLTASHDGAACDNSFAEKYLPLLARSRKLL